MKKILIILAIVAVLIVGGLVGIIAIGLSQVDKIAKASIEYGGTYTTGVDTTVEVVDIGLTDGTAALSGLNIANPEGFETPHFIKLSAAEASVDLNSITTDTIVIPSVHLDGIDLILDKGNDPSNYNQVLENLKRFESDSSDGDIAAAEGKNLVIQSLILDNIDIRVANMPGVDLLAGDVAINIPQIELKNIGEDKPMNVGDIYNLIVKTVLSAAVQAGGGIIPGDVLGELGNGLSGLTSLGDMGVDVISDLNLDEVLGNVGEQVEEALNEIGDQGQKAIDDAGQEVEDAIDNATDNLKGLFGGNKEEDG